jgi:hypothetical protein
MNLYEIVTGSSRAMVTAASFDEAVQLWGAVECVPVETVAELNQWAESRQIRATITEIE